jgi:phosphatidate cytidylyltransferase
MSTQERLFGFQHAFDHQVTLWVTVGAAVVLAAALPAFALLAKAGRIGEPLRAELVSRTVSWMVLAPAILVPILLGAAPTIAAIGVLSLLCYREFSRATGLFRQREVSLIVVIGILAITFAVIDHWYGFFVALPGLTIAVLAAISILRDQPKGYLQRVALGAFAFLLFGVALGHLAYYANDQNYRPMLAMIIAGVELNDVFAFICGKTLGRRKLCPHTSPNKTVEGSLGALVLTTALVATLGHFVFRGTALDSPWRLILLGILVSAGGQLGDLTLSSIKRDLGIKDMGVTIPGHGGLLDRFNSLLLVAPATFHYIGFFLGIGLEQARRIITQGGI